MFVSHCMAFHYMVQNRQGVSSIKGAGRGGVPPSPSSSSASTCEKDFASPDIQSLNTPLRNLLLNGLCFIQFLQNHTKWLKENETLYCYLRHYVEDI